jgi:hypothetical protein
MTIPRATSPIRAKIIKVLIGTPVAGALGGGVSPIGNVGIGNVGSTVACTLGISPEIADTLIGISARSTIVDKIIVRNIIFFNIENSFIIYLSLIYSQNHHTSDKISSHPPNGEYLSPPSGGNLAETCIKPLPIEMRYV